jgi:hypothetical protein
MGLLQDSSAEAATQLARCGLRRRLHGGWNLPLMPPADQRTVWGQAPPASKSDDHLYGCLRLRQRTAKRVAEVRPLKMTTQP